MKNFLLIIFIFCFVGACGSDALTLKKKSSTDEFLVEKKSPLVLPPNYGELPLPSSGQTEINIEEENKFESLITIPFSRSKSKTSTLFVFPNCGGLCKSNISARHIIQ